MSVREAADTLLRSVSAEPTYGEIQRVGTGLLRLQDPGPEVPASRKVRIALASSFTIDPLARALAFDCHRMGLWPSVYVAGYGQFRQALLDPGSDLYAFDPHVVFLAAELASFLRQNDEAGDRQDTLQSVCSEIRELANAFRQRSSALLVIFNFASSPRFPYRIGGGSTELTGEMNRCLADVFADDPQVRILDYQALSAFHGTSRMTSAKLHYLGHVEISDTFLPVVSRKCLAYIGALKGLTRKCLVLDLDGTLWGGVVGEDGIEGIRLARSGQGSEYYEFQLGLLSLFERGVILAINSKNNPADAIQVIRTHPDMVLHEEHFAAIRTNWLDKVTNLRSIADEINLGLDSFVYLDDNPSERAWVRQSLPEVAVYDLPEDPAYFAAFLDNLIDFELLALTDEDRTRGAMYSAERFRKELRNGSANLEEFLKSLRMELHVGRAEQADVARVAQLTRKTNQFNLTTRRYSDGEVMALTSHRDVIVYTLRVRDTFGDNGLVGVAIVRRKDDREILDVVLMSCRVLGRGIEKAFLSEVLKDARQRGVTEVYGEYIPTAKNAVAAQFLGEYGFTLLEQNESGARWRLSLGEWNYEAPKWCTVLWKSRESAEHESVKGTAAV